MQNIDLVHVISNRVATVQFLAKHLERKAFEASFFSNQLG